MTVMDDVERPVASNSLKRSRSWWDCLYTGQELNLALHNWDFTNNKGPSQLLFTSTALDKYTVTRGLRRFKCPPVNFDNCNFDGEFVGEISKTEISFTKCSFFKCDFGGSVWRGVKFSKCKFDKCSFTLAEFQDCIFYECEWVDITLSGTETKLPNTLISNPGNFIASAYTNLDQKTLSQNGTNPAHQIMRLEGTKAKFSRTLLKNAENHGDEDAYFGALKTYLNQSLKSKIKKSTYELRYEKKQLKHMINWCSAWLEILLINITGTLNSWGKSIARPAFIGLLLTSVFGLYYGYLQNDYEQGLIKSFDITFLIGYTKHSLANTPEDMQIWYGINAFLGLWWYAVLVPTIINRISRVN